MNVYHLVFSDHRSVRIRRHLLFWSLWIVYLTVTYLIPTNWIPAWDFHGPTPHIDKYGKLAPLRILSSALMLAVVHAGLVYGVLYYFLPRYLAKNKRWVPTTALLILFLCFMAFVNYFNFVLNFYMSTKVKYFEKMPSIGFILPTWGRQILFNYPTIVGFALAIKLMKNWYIKQNEAAEVAREKINAELQLLKAQVHPHFLFNTLNNIYSFIINGSPDAANALKKLSALLHYIIYECDQQLVFLDKELTMIRDYIDLEKIRYGENFNMNFMVEGTAGSKMISPLLLIPFLENSFKHGASQMLTHPWIKLEIKILETKLQFHLSNSKPSINIENGLGKGLGLSNVRKRLMILHGESHSLNINEDLMSYSVELSIPLVSSHKEITGNFTREELLYELA